MTRPACGVEPLLPRLITSVILAARRQRPQGASGAAFAMRAIVVSSSASVCSGLEHDDRVQTYATAPTRGAG